MYLYVDKGLDVVQLNSIMVSGAVPAAAAAGKERRSMDILKGASPVLVTGIAPPLVTLAFTEIIRDGEEGSYSHRTGPLVTYWGAGRWAKIYRIEVRCE